MSKANKRCACGSGKKARNCCMRDAVTETEPPVKINPVSHKREVFVTLDDVPVTMFEVELSITRKVHIQVAAASLEVLEEALERSVEGGDLCALYDERIMENDPQEDYKVLNGPVPLSVSDAFDAEECEPRTYISRIGTLERVNWGDAGGNPLPYVDVAELEHRIRYLRVLCKDSPEYDDERAELLRLEALYKEAWLDRKAS